METGPSMFDIQRVQTQCDERKSLSETRYTEVKTRLHELANKLQEHENKIALLQREDTANQQTVETLKEQLDELDEIIRGGGPNSPGVVELLGKATRGIEELRTMQESLARQRKDEDAQKTTMLTGITESIRVQGGSLAALTSSVNDLKNDSTNLTNSVDTLKNSDARRTGGWTALEKLLAVGLLFFNLMGVIIAGMNYFRK